MKSLNLHAAFPPEPVKHRVTRADELLLEAQELIQRARADYRMGPGPIAELADDDATDLIARARTSLICIFPAKVGRIHLRELFHRAISTVGHGTVQVKVLYGREAGARSTPHWVFPHEVRSVCQAVPSCVVVDDSVVVISPPGKHGQRRSVRIEDESCVAAYLEFFQDVWHLAEPEGPAPSKECPQCRISTLIVAALTQGATDDRAAPRLGMSVRTYRRHVARILEELQVTSRFQAGLKIAHQGMPCCHR